MIVIIETMKRGLRQKYRTIIEMELILKKFNLSIKDIFIEK